MAGKAIDRAPTRSASASELAERIVEIISTAAHTGKIGDGKVWRMDVSSLLRVRTGEQGTDAL